MGGPIDRERFMITRRESISLVSASALAMSLAPAMHAETLPLPQPVDWTDPLFTQPFIDVDEWRDTPVRHRYVHGGFKGTDALFSMYFPPKEQYQRRFFQHLMAVSGNEFSAQSGTGGNNDIGFAIASGGYAVESNLGKKDMFPSTTDHTLNTIIGYRTSAAVAKYSRVLAAQMYGPHRPYGYVWGGSGGSYKTLSCIENTVGIWDGAVPYIVPSPMAAPNIYTSIGHALRLLKDKMPAIVDAVEPGGSGDMYAGLNPEQRAALLEVTRMGFPPRSWFKYQRLGMGTLPVLMDHFKVWDPTYFQDFWTVPGYLGANPPESLQRARIQHYKTTIRKVVMADEARQRGLPVPMAARSAGAAGQVPAAFDVANLPPGDLVGASMILKSGHEIYISSVVDGLVTVGFGPAAGTMVNSIKAGDPVEIDNSTWLAFQTFHRHQVPPREMNFYIFDQFRGPDGKPLYPQRPELVSLRMNEIGGGTMETGRYAGKMIMVNTLMDEHAAPWNADWYRSLVKGVLGPRIDDRYRLWYVDHGLHGGPELPTDNLHVVNFYGILQQALRDLYAWVEQGVPPPASTPYKVLDSQVSVPATAAERRGIQPVVVLTANGGARADVTVGQPVHFSAVIEAPPGTGAIVAAEWDFEGAGNYPLPGQLSDTRSARVTVQSTYAFSKPGTYFPALRAAAQRNADPGTPYARANNLDRVRVVVK
jgi:hypothetical protein